MKLSYDYYHPAAHNPDLRQEHPAKKDGKREREGGAGDIIILHGLFGRKRNWRSVARDLAEERLVWALDLRSHGESETGILDFSAMAEDLHEFVREHGIHRPVILGHSLGGKCAVEYVFDYPDEAGGIIVVDVSPFEIPEEVCGGLRHIAGVIEDTDLSAVPTKGEAQKILARKVESREIAAFLLQNADRDRERGGFRWRRGTLEAARQIDRVCGAVRRRPSIGGLAEGEGAVEAQASWRGPVLLIRGGASSHFPETHRRPFLDLFPEAQDVGIEGAGHWLHISHREELVKVVFAFLVV